jgi:hypothetical protein
MPNVQVAAVRRGLPDVLIALGRVGRGSPGIDMSPDRGLRPSLVGGAEPEPGRQLRLLHIGEVPLVELGPVAVVHGAPLCQDFAKPSNRFPGPPFAVVTGRAALG